MSELLENIWLSAFPILSLLQLENDPVSGWRGTEVILYPLGYKVSTKLTIFWLCAYSDYVLLSLHVSLICFNSHRLLKQNK